MGLFLRKTKAVKILLYLLACFLILDGNSVYHSLAYRDLNLQWICLAVASALCLFVFQSEMRKDLLATAGLLFGYCWIYFVFKANDVNEGTFVSILIGIPLFLLIFSELEKMQMELELFYCLEKIVLLLAVISLFFWLFGEILDLIHTNMSVTVNWGQIREYKGFYGLKFATSISNSFGKGLPANSGIFTEGPMFCLWLCIALATELFLKESVSKFKTILLITTIFSTLSTTGIFFISMCAAIKYVDYMKGRATTGKIVLTVVLMMLLPVALGALQQVYLLKVGTSSYLIRLQDYRAGVLMWMEDPVFGSGYGRMMSLQKYALVSKAGNVGFSNSIAAILGTGGLWMFAIYAYSIIGPLVKGDSHAKERGFFIAYAFLTIFLIFYARIIMIVFWAFSFYKVMAMYRKREWRD